MSDMPYQVYWSPETETLCIYYNGEVYELHGRQIEWLPTDAVELQP